jgi:hypothetical protein
MRSYVLPMALIGLGALCSLIGSFWLTRVQAQERERSSDARGAFEAELRQKSDEIAKLNRTIASSITGGESWCYLLPSRPHSVPGVKGHAGTAFEPMLVHEGEFPLYDVDLRVTNGSLAGRIVRTAFEHRELPYGSSAEGQAKLAPSETVLRLGNIAPKTAITLMPIAFSEEKTQVFQVSIIARNGAVSETILWERLGSEWKLAFRVMRDQTVLKEGWDKDYPLPAGKTSPW